MVKVTYPQTPHATQADHMGPSSAASQKPPCDKNFGRATGWVRQVQMPGGGPDHWPLRSAMCSLKETERPKYFYILFLASVWFVYRLYSIIKRKKKLAVFIFRTSSNSISSYYGRHYPQQHRVKRPPENGTVHDPPHCSM